MAEPSLALFHHLRGNSLLKQVCQFLIFEIMLNTIYKHTVSISELSNTFI